MIVDRCNRNVKQLRYVGIRHLFDLGKKEHMLASRRQIFYCLVKFLTFFLRDYASRGDWFFGKKKSGRSSIDKLLLCTSERTALRAL